MNDYALIGMFLFDVTFTALLPLIFSLILVYGVRHFWKRRRTNSG